MDSEEPPNVRVACSGDIDEVVRLNTRLEELYAQWEELSGLIF
ncbi:hypothetical protein [Trichlorobacter lovleyi]